MFGKGIYLADMSSKSANYCCSHSSGGTGLLLLCEAELGDPPLKLTNADYNAEDRVKAANALSTWGVGRTAPQAWKDAGAVHETLKGVNMPDVVSVATGNTNEAGAYLQYNEVSPQYNSDLTTLICSSTSCTMSLKSNCGTSSE